MQSHYYVVQLCRYLHTYFICVCIGVRKEKYSNKRGVMNYTIKLTHIAKKLPKKDMFYILLIIYNFYILYIFALRFL